MSEDSSEDAVRDATRETAARIAAEVERMIRSAEEARLDTLAYLLNIALEQVRRDALRPVPAPSPQVANLFDGFPKGPRAR